MDSEPAAAETALSLTGALYANEKTIRRRTSRAAES